MRYSSIVCVALAGLPLALFGCGSGDGESNGAAAQPRAEPLSDRQVARYREGSPEWVVLDWWRQLQFENASAAASHYADVARVSGRELSIQLPQVRSSLAATPRIDDVDRTAEGAIVYTLLRSKAADADGKTRVVERPRAFTLRREGGEWRLADNFFLDEALAAVRRAKREANKTKR